MSASNSASDSRRRRAFYRSATSTATPRPASFFPADFLMPLGLGMHISRICHSFRKRQFILRTQRLRHHAVCVRRHRRLVLPRLFQDHAAVPAVPRRQHRDLRNCRCLSCLHPDCFWERSRWVLSRLALVTFLRSASCGSTAAGRRGICSSCIWSTASRSCYLGLMVPWAAIRVARYELQGLSLAPAAEIGAFAAAMHEQVTATGDEAGELLEIRYRPLTADRWDRYYDDHSRKQHGHYRFRRADAPFGILAKVHRWRRHRLQLRARRRARVLAPGQHPPSSDIRRRCRNSRPQTIYREFDAIVLRHEVAPGLAGCCTAGKARWAMWHWLWC